MRSAVLLLCVVLAAQASAYQMTRCQLVKALRKNKFPESQLRNWVCLVEHESSRRTEVIGKANTDGSHDHGLFQINDRYWCSNTKTPGKGCHVTCAKLRSKNIAKASACAKKIFKVHGFNAWYGWVDHCKGALPDISKC